MTTRDCVNKSKMASEVNEIGVQAAENLTENNEAITGRIPSTSEGMVLAYGSLIIMAILPIFFGSYRAVKHHKEQQVSHAFDICFERILSEIPRTIQRLIS